MKTCNSNCLTIEKTIKSARISKWASSKEGRGVPDTFCWWNQQMTCCTSHQMVAPPPPPSHNLHQLILLYHYWPICWEMSWGVKEAQSFKIFWMNIRRYSSTKTIILAENSEQAYILTTGMLQLGDTMHTREIFIRIDCSERYNQQNVTNYSLRCINVLGRG